MPGPYEKLYNTLRCLMVDEAEPVILVPVQYDNAPFRKPTDSGWVRFKIETTDDRQADVGTKLRRFRIEGVAIAEVSIKINRGDLEAIVIADSIATIFRGRDFQGVTLKTPVVKPLGRRGKEWVVECRCPFQTDNFF